MVFLTCPSYTLQTMLSAVTVSVVTLAALAAALATCQSSCPLVSAFYRSHSHSFLLPPCTGSRLSSTMPVSSLGSHRTCRDGAEAGEKLHINLTFWKHQQHCKGSSLLFCGFLPLALLKDQYKDFAGMPHLLFTQHS